MSSVFKYRFLFFIALVAFGGVDTRAQNRTVDSLKFVLKNAKHDTARCIILNLMVNSESDISIWPKYNTQMKEIAEKNLETNPSGQIKTVYLKYLATSLSNMGLIYSEKGENAKAMENYLKALKIREGLKDKYEIADSYLNIGLIYGNEGNWQKALEYYKKSMKYCEETNNKNVLANCLLNIGAIYEEKGDFGTALDYSLKGTKVYEETANNNALANSYNNIGTLYKHLGNIKTSILYLTKGLKINEENGDKSGIANSLGNIAYMHQEQGDIRSALDLHIKALKIKEEIDDKEGMASSFINIGSIYQSLGELKNGLDYYLNALKVSESIKNKNMMCNSFNNIGSIYKDEGNTEKAIEYYEQGLKLADENEFGNLKTVLLINKGVVYQSKDLEKAQNCFLEALKIIEKSNNKGILASCLVNLGNNYIKRHDQNKAIIYLKRALIVSKELGFPAGIRDAAKSLTEIYRTQNKFKEAFEMKSLFVQMADSLNNAGIRKEGIKKQFQYEYEKRDAVINTEHKFDLEKQQAVADEKDRKQKIVIWSVVLGLLLVIVFVGFVFRSLNITRKQKVQIEIKNKETEAQKEIIEEKQKEILDSIHYAKRIQTALITNEKYIDKNLERLTKKS